MGAMSLKETMSLAGFGSGQVWLLASAVAIVTFMLPHLLTVRVDPQEPPLLKPWIPVIGHIIGLLRGGREYIAKLMQKDQLIPICTIQMGPLKQYLVTSPELIQGVFRSRTMTFDVFLKDLVASLTGMAPGDARRFGERYSDWIKVITGNMSKEQLVRTTPNGLRKMLSTVNKVGAEATAVDDLYVWLRDAITLATSTALWGADNPLEKDRSLIGAYWEYEHDVQGLLLGFIPSLMAPKAYNARNKIREAFERFYITGCSSNADVAPIIAQKLQIEKSFGLPPSASAALDVAILHGSVANTGPVTFFLVNLIYSHPALLSKLREEATTVVTAAQPGNRQQREIAIDISAIETKCPLLHAAFKETLRLVVLGSIRRRILTDTVLTDSDGRAYLLKAGCDIEAPMMPHQDPRLWGTSVNDFDVNHFLDSESRTEAGRSRRKGFFPFGGGRHLCPGRNFAAGEVLGTLVALVMSCDITGVQGEQLRVAKAKVPGLASAVCTPAPDQDLGARISRRKGWEDVVWTVAG